MSNKFVDFEELKIVDLHQHLAGHDRRETSSGADSDPNKSTVHKNSRSSRKVQKAKGSLHLTAQKGFFNGKGKKRGFCIRLHISFFFFHLRIISFLGLYAVHKEDSDADTGRTNEILASGRNSFSQALKGTTQNNCNCKW